LPGGQLKQDAEPEDAAVHPVGQSVHERGSELTSTLPTSGKEYNM